MSEENKQQNTEAMRYDTVLADCKKLYNRKDVIEIIYKVLRATGKEIKAEMKNIPCNAYIEYDGSDLEKWIEANL